LYQSRRVALTIRRKIYYVFMCDVSCAVLTPR
jgi:hypothetical protein